MFEHHRHPLLSREEYFKRLLKNFGVAAIIIAIALGIGILGYHVFGRLPWIDAFLNASMILTGMGPVDTMTTPSAKIFASCYALFSGIAFLSIIVIVLAPIIHRFLHTFHLEDDQDNARL
ncbi:MAG: hypothetical protein HY540_04720 [Deltaproteobacteria bacterium]|nr:hypothetical protein [Deltaproteobacteria bacterium]